MEHDLIPFVATPIGEASVTLIVVFSNISAIVGSDRGLGDDVFHLRHSLANVHLTEIDKLNVTCLSYVSGRVNGFDFRTK